VEVYSARYERDKHFRIRNGTPCGWRIPIYAWPHSAKWGWFTNALFQCTPWQHK
jgi:hypothetical protein